MRVEFRVGNLGLMCTNGGLGPPVRGFPVLGEGLKTGNKSVLIPDPGNAVDLWVLIVTTRWSTKVSLCDERVFPYLSVPIIILIISEDVINDTSYTSYDLSGYSHLWIPRLSFACCHRSDSCMTLHWCTVASNRLPNGVSDRGYWLASIQYARANYTRTMPFYGALQ